MQERLRNLRRDSLADPCILLTDTNRWPVVPRLAMRFEKLGAKVAVLCATPGHPVESLRERVQIFSYSGFQPLSSLRMAVETFRPDIIIPACDRSVQHLHELHGACQAEDGRAALSMSLLIERSLGSPQSFSIVSNRYALLQTALEEGIRVPKLLAINEVSDLEHLSAEIPAPWVIKTDGTWGGRGVRVAYSLAEAGQCLRELTSRPDALQLMKRMSLNRDRDWVYLDWSRPRPAVVAQAFIPGRPANCAAVCRDGEVLAVIAVEVIQSQGPTGPATIVQVVPGGEMMQAAERIARRLRLSGFFGLDFVIEERTGATYLIEMNPRCTPPCPLPLGESRDLVAAFWSHLKEQPMPHTVSVTDKSRIAYFPQASLRAPDAPDTILSSSFVDIPAEEPNLVHQLRNPWVGRSLLGRFLDWIRQRLVREESTCTTRTVLFERAMEIQPTTVADLDV
ncbi:ATP-grasp domain-containing protein [Alloacidobacterium dinghuense]|uniref:ATP-grasp domain-containing protein n=1 Tax=Alloacidobacterium dinghuense TaxID=2763107 RepID=A0A7G8BLT3_9BACT|nr:ATP-grasp domain-containing protein [Alloacidobacterium dinghuense]QNI33503.1 ATP-grasp domain-containing protein [Alloacidobacterium dinghuense]